MAEQATVLRAIKDAVKARNSETGERSAVAQVLARHGWVGVPEIKQAKAADGRTVRIYAFFGTPAGDIALIAGPDVDGNVVRLEDIEAEQAEHGFYIEAVSVHDKVHQETTQQFSRIAERVAGKKATRVSHEPRPDLDPVDAGSWTDGQPGSYTPPGRRAGMDYDVGGTIPRSRAHAGQHRPGAGESFQPTAGQAGMVHRVPIGRPAARGRAAVEAGGSYAPANGDEHVLHLLERMHAAAAAGNRTEVERLHSEKNTYERKHPQQISAKVSNDFNFAYSALARQWFDEENLERARQGLGVTVGGVKLFVKRLSISRRTAYGIVAELAPQGRQRKPHELWWPIAFDSEEAARQQVIELLQNRFPTRAEVEEGFSIVGPTETVSDREAAKPVPTAKAKPSDDELMARFEALLRKAVAAQG